MTIPLKRGTYAVYETRRALVNMARPGAGTNNETGGGRAIKVGRGMLGGTYYRMLTYSKLNVSL